VRVNDVLWHETPTLFGRGPRDRAFITRANDDGRTTVQFGDGMTGARLPSGHENVEATYRQGIGLAGLVKAGQLSLLMAPPLGVQEVTNPTAAAGAADRESRDDARENAPRTVLTLDRIVSLRDYEDFARGYAGIAKALATWTWDGHTRGVFLTVAGPRGAEIKIEGDFGLNLFRAIRNAGDPFVPVQLKSYKKGAALFHLAARVKVDPDYETPVVLSAVEAALRAQFSFEAREFGQPVASSEVIAVMQSVRGVTAIDLNKLYRVGGSPTDRLLAALPQAGAGGTLAPAEILVLDSAPLEQLEAMT
jgi:predicted phage baseplate assembly protein